MGPFCLSSRTAYRLPAASFLSSPLLTLSRWPPLVLPSLGIPRTLFCWRPSCPLLLRRPYTAAPAYCFLIAFLRNAFFCVLRITRPTRPLDRSLGTISMLSWGMVSNSYLTNYYLNHVSESISWGEAFNFCAQASLSFINSNCVPKAGPCGIGRY